ncbi:hypothetical protein BaRGS_00006018, partial [Batillaria attramentaria]
LVASLRGQHQHFALKVKEAQTQRQNPRDSGSFPDGRRGSANQHLVTHGACWTNARRDRRRQAGCRRWLEAVYRGWGIGDGAGGRGVSVRSDRL